MNKMKIHVKIRFVLFFSAVIFLFIQISPTAGNCQEFEDTLTFFMEETKVITAARRSQKIFESPLAIDVITRREIEQSGVRFIWDLLRFRVGVNVIQGWTTEGNRAQVSIRGLNEEYVLPLLVLVDGLSVMDQLNGGVFWGDIPVTVNEIERIEIVRGPNSALFGSNAGYGVINILTRKAGGDSSFEITAITGNEAFYRIHTAGDIVKKNFTTRVSMERQYYGGSRPVVEVPGIFTDDNIASDRVMVRSHWDLGERTRLEGFFSAGRDRYARCGDTSSFSLSTSPWLNIIRNRQMMRLITEVNEENTLEVMTAHSDRHYTDDDHSYWIREKILDIDVLDQFEFLDGKVKNVVGVSGRLVNMESPVMFNANRVGDGDTKMNEIYRSFLSTILQLKSWLSLAAAVSLENSDTGGMQYAGQSSLMFQLNSTHVLRMGISRAPNLPAMASQYANHHVPIVKEITPGVPVTVVMEGNPDFEPIVVSAYDISLQGRYMQNRLTTELTAYLSEVDGANEIVRRVSLPYELLSWTNYYFLRTRGLEARLDYNSKMGNGFYLNYTYEEIDVDRVAETISRETPRHKINAGFRLSALKKINLAVNLAYSSKYESYRVVRGIRIS